MKRHFPHKISLTVLTFAIWAIAFPNDSMTLDRLLLLNETAMGMAGPKKFESFLKKSELRFASPGNEPLIGQLVQKFKVPNKTMSVVTLGNKLLTARFFNGENGWEISGESGTVRPLRNEELEKFTILSALSNPKTDLRQLFEAIELEEVVERGETNYRLHCRSIGSNAEPLTLYVSGKTFLVTSIETTFRVNGSEIQYRSTIESRAMIEGLPIPTKTRVETMGASQTYILKDFKLNVAFEDSEFDLPNEFH